MMIKEKIKKLFEHKEIKILIVLFFIILFSVVLNVSYSAFNARISNQAANIKVKNLEYAMAINEVSGVIITSNANDITKSSVNLSSLNSSDTKYELSYDICSDSSCTSFIEKPNDLTIEYSSRTPNTLSGTILANGSKTIRIITTNTSANTYYIKLKINAGYGTNTLALENKISSMYDEDDLIIAAYINGNLNTSFPTTSKYTADVTCTSGGETTPASGSASWNSIDKRWELNVSKIITGETRCNIYFEESNPNVPVLLNNMIPITYDGTNWIYADTSTEWYDYGSQKWANAAVLKSGVTKTVGSTIDVASDVSLMYVWIPRYEYKIEGTYGKGGTSAASPGSITIKFKDNSTADEGFIMHPAFTFDSKEKTGFWFGKFENANVTSCTSANNSVGTGCDLTNLGIKIIPNVTAWDGSRVYTFYVANNNVASANSISNGVTHAMKNSEWGAVAYLSQSNFGRCSGGTCSLITQNNSSSGITGNAGNTPISDYVSGITNAYNTPGGVLASTTGNIYGVYDMSGGYQEVVMAAHEWKAGSEYITSGSSAEENSGFTGYVFDMSAIQWKLVTQNVNPERKYLDIFTTNSTLTACGGSPCNGHALNETEGWNGNIKSFSSGINAWITRGGMFSGSTSKGIFAVNITSGASTGGMSSRNVLMSSN